MNWYYASIVWPKQSPNLSYTAIKLNSCWYLQFRLHRWKHGADASVTDEIFAHDPFSFQKLVTGNCVWRAVWFALLGFQFILIKKWHFESFVPIALKPYTPSSIFSEKVVTLPNQRRGKQQNRLIDWPWVQMDFSPLNIEIIYRWPFQSQDKYDDNLEANCWQGWSESQKAKNFRIARFLSQKLSG